MSPRPAAFLFAALSLLAVWLAGASDAHATRGETVVLVHPGGDDPALEEVFHRLRGELTLHGFEVEEADAEASPNANSLERAADRRGAVASVTFVPRAPSDLSSVDVWVSDRVTGKTIKRTVTPETDRDPATIIAVRTVELLRASLREYRSSRAEGPRDVSGAHRERASRVVTELTRPEPTPPPPQYAYLGIAGALVHSFPDGSIAGGAELYAGYQHEHLGLRLVGQGPFLGGRVDGAAGFFRYLSIGLLLEPTWSPLRDELWSLTIFPSVGTTYLEVRGEAVAPFAGRDDSSWLVSLGGGAEATMRLRQALMVHATVRSLAQLPRAVVTVANEQRGLGLPDLSLSLGLRLAL